MRPAILARDARSLRARTPMVKRGDFDGQARSSGRGTLPGAPAIPDKLYFRIGEVAALCRVPTHVLRFWQTEFAQLRPGKSGTGQRLYRRRDVEMALRIKGLLHDKGYTLAGARGVLAGAGGVPVPGFEPEPPPAMQDGGNPPQATLGAVRDELRALLCLLKRELPGHARRDNEPQPVVFDDPVPRE